MKKDWTEVALREVLFLDVDAVEVDPTQTYPFAGVYGFGRGIFARENVRGVIRLTLIFIGSMRGHW